MEWNYFCGGSLELKCCFSSKLNGEVHQGVGEGTLCCVPIEWTILKKKIHQPNKAKDDLLLEFQSKLINKLHDLCCLRCPSKNNQFLRPCTYKLSYQANYEVEDVF